MKQESQQELIKGIIKDKMTQRESQRQTETDRQKVMVRETLMLLGKCYNS